MLEATVYVSMLRGGRVGLRRCRGSSLCEHGRQRAHLRSLEAAVYEHASRLLHKDVEAAVYVSMAGKKYNARNVEGSSQCEHGRQKLNLGLRKQSM
jgi:hypothetical protein